jgi:hypothetical protein
MQTTDKPRRGLDPPGFLNERTKSGLSGHQLSDGEDSKGIEKLKRCAI